MISIDVSKIEFGNSYSQHLNLSDETLLHFARHVKGIPLSALIPRILPAYKCYEGRRLE